MRDGEGSGGGAGGGIRIVSAGVDACIGTRRSEDDERGVMIGEGFTPRADQQLS